MTRIIDEISVFFPAYNEEENIETTVLNSIKILEKVAEKWEVIIIDDGSKDRTGEIADRLSKDNPNISVVHNKPNRGYGGALKSGFSASKYKWIAFTDADGQFDFGEIIKFIDKSDNSDLVLGYRSNRADPTIRRLYTFVWSVLLPRILFGLKARDYSCGFKLIKKEVINRVGPLVGEEKVTQIELLVKAKRLGFRFAEVGVRHYPRKFGKQTGANLDVVLKSLIGLIKLWKKLNRS